MLSVQTIEEAIQQLPKSDLAKLRDWFLEFDDRAWDKQIAKNGVRSHIPTFELQRMGSGLTFQHSNWAVCLRRAKSNSHGTKAPLQLPPA